jgi:hypothetical protein
LLCCAVRCYWAAGLMVSCLLYAGLLVGVECVGAEVSFHFAEGGGY